MLNHKIIFAACLVICPSAFAAQAAQVTPLEQAVILLSSGNVNATDEYGLTATHHLAQSKNFRMIQTLRDPKINAKSKNFSRMTPLHLAAQDNNVGAVQLLLSLKADPSSLNIGGNTPLHLAALVRSLDVIQSLISAKADLNSRNKLGQTPEDIARDPRYYKEGNTNLLIAQMLKEARVAEQKEE